MSDLITPLCTVAWADQFFTEFTYSDVWTDASSAKKLSAVKSATHFFNLFVTFYNNKHQEIVYTPDGTDDWNDEHVPRDVKMACAQEASYLLSLDDNPAEPHPLTILGMLSADGKRFDLDMVPPIIPTGVIRSLEKIGADIDREAYGGNHVTSAAKGAAY